MAPPAPLFAALLIALFAAPPVAAGQLQIEIGTVVAPAVRARAVRLDLRWEEGVARAELQAARVAGAGGGVDAPRLQCARLHLDAGVLSCEGLRLRADAGALGTVTGSGALHYGGAGTRGNLALDLGGAGRLSARLERRAASWQAAVGARALDLGWLQRAAVRAGAPVPELAELAGQVTLDATVEPDAARLTADFADLAFSATSVGEDLAGRVRLTLRREVTHETVVSFDAHAVLSAGLAWIEPGLTLRGLRPGWTLEVGADPFTLRSAGRWYPHAARLELEAAFEHPAVTTLAGTARIRLAPGAALERARVRVQEAVAGPLYATYLQPLLLGTRLDQLEVAGTVAGAVTLEGTTMRDLELTLRDLHAYDAGERFHVAGLDGTLAVSAGAETRRSHLRWDGVGVYRLLFGPGAVGFASRRGELQLEEWTDVPFLDGALALDTLAVTLGAGTPQVALSGRLTPVAMTDLSQALGWPLMHGTVSGRIDGLRYRGGDLRMDGELRVDAFDGHITLRDLRVDDLFGTVPRLQAGARFEGLDLEPLTRAFSFGRITGRLDGYVRDLRLQAWEPVYFEAALATPADDDSPHRISQRAVDNLGVLGGGTGGAVSRGLLRFFDEYSYGRLGISARLYNGWVELGGVQDAADGFYILTRGGLLPPWIDVKGTGRSIQWSALVEGLKTIARGEVVIE